MSKLFVAVYIDLENIATNKLRLDVLMKTLELVESTDQDNFNQKPVFAIKSAYGSLDTLSASNEFKNQLITHGFYIFHTPKVAEMKNRADLFISLDAFESLYLNHPSIDRYIFMTSDVDFTVIGEKLRKYGKEVWLVCRKQDRNRVILPNAFDKLFFLEDYYAVNRNFLSKNETQENDRLAKQAFIEVLKTIDIDTLPRNISILHDRMKTADPGLSMKNTTFRSFAELAKYFEQEKVIATVKDNCWMLSEINYSRIEALLSEGVLRE